MSREASIARPIASPRRRPPACFGRRLPGVCAWALAFAVVLPGSGAGAQVRFVDRSAELGVSMTFAFGDPDRPYITDSGGAGAAWLDFDADGKLDLLLLSGLPGPSDRPAEATRAAQAGNPLSASRLADGTVPGNRLFRNAGDGFAPTPERAGLATSGWAAAAAVADFDDDGFPDVYVTAIGPNRLYRNNGDGTFTAVDAGIEHPGWGTGAAFVDLDLDGDLDLYVANYVDFDASTGPPSGEGACTYQGLDVFCGPRGLPGGRDVLYRNEGDGSFVEWPGLEPDPDATYGFAVLPTDCDDDGRPEIYVANDSNINLLYRYRDGTLEDLSLFSGAGYSGGGLEQAGMGISAGDFDEDGDFDLVVSNFQHDYVTLYRNDGDCTFVDVTPEVGLAGPTYPFMSWAPLLVDFDGDTDLDLFVANGHIYPQVEAAGLEPFGQADQLFLNVLRERGRAAFVAAADGGGAPLTRPRSSRGAAWGDPDNDGDPDLVVTYIDAPPAVLIQEGEPAGAWLRVSLVGRSSPRSAYGARIELRSGDRTRRVEHHHGDGYLGSNDPRQLFSLPTGRADELRILWPSGETTSLADVGPGWIVVHEGRGIVATRR